MELQAIQAAYFKSTDSFQSNQNLSKIQNSLLQLILKSIRMESLFFNNKSSISSVFEGSFQEFLECSHVNSVLPEDGIFDTSNNESEYMDIILNNIAQATPFKRQVRDEPAISNQPNSIHEFVVSIWPKAEKAAGAMGVDPKILVAQAALETGWGKHITRDADGNSSHNVFNIKTGQDKTGKAIQVKTTEYVDNIPMIKTESFKSYDSIEHSFNDYVSLIMNHDRYQDVLAHVDSPEAYIHAVHKAGYATDPEYAKKVLAIYHSDHLNEVLTKNT